MNTSDPRAPRIEPDPATDHLAGPARAEVTVIEYGDFECPSCRLAHPAMKFLQSQHGQHLRFAFRHYPLREVHPHAEMAAEAAEAAGAQQQFWAYHDLLFAHQDHLDAKHLTAYAAQLGLDMPRFENELKDHVYRQRVQEQIASGLRFGVRATPTFFVNGKLADVSFGIERLQAAVGAALAAH